MIISIVKSKYCLQIFPVNLLLSQEIFLLLYPQPYRNFLKLSSWLIISIGFIPNFVFFSVNLQSHRNFWNYPPELNNFILLQNLLKWKMFFKYLLLRKKLRSSSIITIHLISDNLPIFLIQDYPSSILVQICLHKTYLWITSSILVQSLPTQKIPMNNLFLNQNPWYQKSPFDKNIT